jgi:excisionase family DNA binding protein
MSTTVVEHPTEILLYSRKAAAIALSVSLRSIDYLIEDGRLPTRRLGKEVMIPGADLRKFAKSEHTEDIRTSKNQ